MTSSVARWAGLQLYSLAVAWFTLCSMFVMATGLVGLSYVVPTVLVLASAVASRYVAVYHRFSRRRYWGVASFATIIAFVVAVTVAARSFPSAISPNDVLHLFRQSSIRIGSSEFLPEWWLAGIYAPSGLLMLVGVLRTRSLSPYPKPGSASTLVTSPVYFGATCALFGFWAVLLVGFAIQRVIVIAPIFEELLKFGVALLAGSVLFDRSTAARIGTAIVVGSLFGVVEHHTTYPTETDVAYLYRTLFHTSTTVLSVSVYTVFESRGETRLQWLAPSYSMLLHFFSNTFAVLSSVLLVLVTGSPGGVIQFVYWAAANVLAVALALLTIAYPSVAVAIHRPLEQVLSDLV